MNFIFADRDLLRLFTDDSGPAKVRIPPPVRERFFAAMDDVLAAVDERDLRAIAGYHFEKVPSVCNGCYSLRLGKQFRLIVRIVSIENEPGLEIVDVLDYH
ncbi:MAG TPA: type II toxin-antitoxin system RelE/ParE family toxin [Fimbriimonas sp.]|nr:type II toxin-antitoxin system RelE/ParE family toxin [Fimbriimonas sp.]